MTDSGHGAVRDEDAGRNSGNAESRAAGITKRSSIHSSGEER